MIVVYTGLSGTFKRSALWWQWWIRYSLTRLLFLLCDDDNDSLFALDKVLSSYWYSVIPVNNGREALDLARDRTSGSSSS